MEITLPSGRTCKLRPLSDSTLRLAIKNPLLMRLFKAAEDGVEPEITNEDGMAVLERLDKIVARVVEDPLIFVPSDLDDPVPPGMVSIEDFTSEDKAHIWSQVLAAASSVVRLAPFRGGTRRGAEPSSDG